MQWGVDIVGPKDTLDYRVHLTIGGQRISFWHDVPLFTHPGDPHTYFNMVCEIPKWSRAKYEIATGTTAGHSCLFLFGAVCFSSLHRVNDI